MAFITLYYIWLLLQVIIILELVAVERIWITFRQLGGSVYNNAPYFIRAHMFGMEILIRKKYISS